MPQIKILKAGLFSTLQDAGRFGTAHLGIPKSGVMDTYAYRYANALLQNEETAPVIEMTLKGGEFQFSALTQIVVSGALAPILLNGTKVEQHTRISVQANDVLKIGVASHGFRIYLSIKGGFQAEEHYGSHSQYLPITGSNKLDDGNVLNYSEFNAERASKYAKVRYEVGYFSEIILKVYKGQEFGKLTQAQKKSLFSQEFKINSTSNRMAYQFEERFKNNLDPILTAPVLPGTVQLTPSGQLIVLMQDCQTTGGYPRVLQLSDTALNILAQKPFGKRVKFKQIDF